MSFRRPEHAAPPEIFYSKEEAQKYTSNSRMIAIQSEMSERAIELLALPADTPCLILDIGCGSGLSGQVLEENGHGWIGVDISEAMLDVAKTRDLEGDVMLGDMGQGLGFRAGVFDGAISISALQWLCNADKKSHNPVKRLRTFFSSLYSSLAQGTRAVFQFYPENDDQISLITQQAMKAGFRADLVVDYPNSTKAKKIFLVLFCGVSSSTQKPAGLMSEKSVPRFKKGGERGKSVKSVKNWILEKKERRRRQGKEVRENSKYTGRKRSKKF